jgi:hypothetical protein
MPVAIVGGPSAARSDSENGCVVDVPQCTTLLRTSPCSALRGIPRVVDAFVDGFVSQPVEVAQLPVPGPSIDDSVVDGRRICYMLLRLID